MRVQAPLTWEYKPDRDWEAEVKRVSAIQYQIMAHSEESINKHNKNIRFNEGRQAREQSPA